VPTGDCNATPLATRLAVGGDAHPAAGRSSCSFQDFDALRWPDRGLTRSIYRGRKRVKESRWWPFIC